MATKKNKVDPTHNIPPGTFWMIRNSKGQYSNGAGWPSFVSQHRGKRWSIHGVMMGHLSRVHRLMNQLSMRGHPYEDAVVVQFQSTEIDQLPAKEYGK